MSGSNKRLAELGGEGRFEAVQIHLTGRDAKIVKRGHGCGRVRFDAEDQAESERFLAIVRSYVRSELICDLPAENAAESGAG